jgi:Uncharacterized protein conserved in bacteria
VSELIERPEVQVFAGPNGSGKSTITSTFPIVGEYVNADDIQKQEGITPLQAAELALKLKQYYIRSRISFTFETVMSSHYNMDILQEAKSRGFVITVVYVITCDPEINVDRVHRRARNGGHDVPEEKIRTRYYKSLSNIKQVFLLSDNFVLIDNSRANPALLVDKTTDQIRVFPDNDWSSAQIAELLTGKKA